MSERRVDRFMLRIGVDVDRTARSRIDQHVSVCVENIGGE